MRRLLERLDPDHSLAVTASILGITFLVSQFLPAAHQSFSSSLSPLFVAYSPHLGWGIVAPIAVGAVLVVLAPSLRRTAVPVALGVLVVFAFVLATTLAMEAGKTRSLNGCCIRGGAAATLTYPLHRKTDYYQAIPVIERLGWRRFSAQFPELDRPHVYVLPEHVGTHSPGGPLLLWAFWRLGGRSDLFVAMMIVLVGALGVVPTYLIARELRGKEAGMAAALLYTCAPGVLLFSATSMDAVFMTATAVALAALVRAFRSVGWAVAGGALWTAAIALTWGALAVAPLLLGVAVVWIASGRVARRDAIRAGLLVLGGVVAAGVLLRVVVDFDLGRDFVVALGRQVSNGSRNRSYLYWVPGDLVAFLATLGIGQSANLIRATRRSWRRRELGVEAALWGTLLLLALTGVFRGEADHNWLFFVPLALAVGAADAPVRPPMGLGLTQATVTEVLLYTSW